jgi:hypothetical protein
VQRPCNQLAVAIISNSQLDYRRRASTLCSTCSWNYRQRSSELSTSSICTSGLLARVTTISASTDQSRRWTIYVFPVRLLASLRHQHKPTSRVDEQYMYFRFACLRHYATCINRPVASTNGIRACRLLILFALVQRQHIRESPYPVFCEPFWWPSSISNDRS